LRPGSRAFESRRPAPVGYHLRDRADEKELTDDRLAYGARRDATTAAFAELRIRHRSGLDSRRDRAANSSRPFGANCESLLPAQHRDLVMLHPQVHILGRSANSGSQWSTGSAADRVVVSD